MISLYHLTKDFHLTIEQICFFHIHVKNMEQVALILKFSLQVMLFYVYTYMYLYYYLHQSPFSLSLLENNSI